MLISSSKQMIVMTGGQKLATGIVVGNRRSCRTTIQYVQMMIYICVCAYLYLSLPLFLSLSLALSLYLYIYMCVCVWLSCNHNSMWLKHVVNMCGVMRYKHVNHYSWKSTYEIISLQKVFSSMCITSACGIHYLSLFIGQIRMRNFCKINMKKKKWKTSEMDVNSRQDSR